MSCRNCMGGCVHHKMKEVYKDSIWKDGSTEVLDTVYEHYCDKNQDGYAEWHEIHKHHTYDEYKNSEMSCYEPTEMVDALNKCLDATKSLLNEISKNGTE